MQYHVYFIFRVPGDSSDENENTQFVQVEMVCMGDAVSDNGSDDVDSSSSSSNRGSVSSDRVECLKLIAADSGSNV